MEGHGKLVAELLGRVLQLTIANIEQRNALHPDMYRDGRAALVAAANDSRIGAVVLTGENGNFSSGGNLQRLRRNREEPAAVQWEGISLFHDWIREIRQFPKPVIAAVEGTAAGAGFSLALACDLIVAAEASRFVMAYVKVGLSPDGGGSVFLTKALPRSTVMEILLEGSMVTAVRLHELGVVTRLCPPGEALEEALSWAERLAAGPCNAMARIKALANSAESTDLSAQLDREREMFVEGLFSAECEEGIAAFLGKRAPVFGKGATK